MNIYDLISRAQKLRKETQLDSVSPDRVGGLHEDTLKYINEFQLLASSPSLHKIYASVSAMQSDKSPKSDLTGKPLKPGQLVVIVPANQTDATAGDVYRYDGPSGNTSAWTFVAKIGAVPADAELSATSTNPPQNKVVTEKLTELESEVGSIKDGVPLIRTEQIYDKSSIRSSNFWLDGRTDVIGSYDTYRSFAIPIEGKAGETYCARLFDFDESKLASSQPLRCGVSNDKSVGAAVLQIQTSYSKSECGITLNQDAKYFLVTVNFASIPTEEDAKELEDCIMVVKSDTIPTELKPYRILEVSHDNLDKNLKTSLDNIGENSKSIDVIKTTINLQRTSQIFNKDEIENQHFIIDTRKDPAVLTELSTSLAFIVPIEGKVGDVYSISLIEYDTSKLKPITSQPIRIAATNNTAIGSQVLQVKTTYDNKKEQITLNQEADYLVITFQLVNPTEEGFEELKNSLVVVKGNEYPNEYINYYSVSIPSNEEKFLFNKKIVWYGTSIPAGTPNNFIAFDGLPSKSVSDYSDIRRELDGKSCPNQYPAMVGSILGGGIVFNEAIGSSRVTSSPSHGNLELRCKALGNSVQDIIGWIEGSYNIDWVNKSYSKNTNNKIGISVWFSEGLSWNMFVWKCFSCMRMSYELALVARYLISDTSEHDNYVRLIFGDRYDTIRDAVNGEGWDFDGKVSYQDDIDLFVFDHGWNDGIEKYSGNLNDNTVDTFEGGYNTFFNAIMRYKPNSRVVIASCYTNYRENQDKISRQKAIAERWQFPFIDISKLLPMSKTFKTTFRGYWDGEGKWHDNGFTWSESGSNYTTNNTMFDVAISALEGKSPTLANIKEVFNPHQENGVWVWDGYQVCLYTKDGVHPSSDNEGRINKIYARCLAQWIKTI